MFLLSCLTTSSTCVATSSGNLPSKVLVLDESLQRTCKFDRRIGRDQENTSLRSYLVDPLTRVTTSALQVVASIIHRANYSIPHVVDPAEDVVPTRLLPFFVIPSLHSAAGCKRLRSLHCRLSTARGRKFSMEKFSSMEAATFSCRERVETAYQEVPPRVAAVFISWPFPKGFMGRHA